MGEPEEELCLMAKADEIRVSVRGNSSTYVLNKRLGGTKRFTLYRCVSEACPERQLIFKIATAVEQNGCLEREAFLLRLLHEESVHLEGEYKRETGSSIPLNYHLYFPDLIETWIVENQGSRRALVFGFEVVDDLGCLVPLAHVRTRDRVRVDPKTSVWILGKALKALAFVHDQGISIGNVSGENILIERDQHSVSILDWSAATLHPDGSVPCAVACEEIRQVAREVVLVLGGDVSSGRLLVDDQLSNDRYERFLGSLVCGERNSAYDVHREFYELVTSLWGRKFHPYSSYPLDC